MTALALLCYPNTLISTLALLAPVVLLLYAQAMASGRPFAAGAGLVALVCWLFGGALFLRGAPPLVSAPAVDAVGARPAAG